ncbi:MAG: OsmC family protein [Cyclobacteriaceae bacterium]|nr:OsmC family protein [Cyclobacteriaceae bacterium]
MGIVHQYDVAVRWESGRVGELTSPDFAEKLNVVTPPEFPSGIAGHWSPEHLFTAAVNGCLMTTFLAIAENSKLSYDHFESNGSGKLEMVDGKYMMTEVTLSPTLIIKQEADRERAMRVLQKAEAACLISNSIKSKIIFRPEVRVAEFVPA